MDEKIKHDSMAGKFEPPFKDRIKLAFQEFLWIPTVAIVIFILLAALTYMLDHSQPAWADDIRSLLEFYFFRDAEMTHDFLGTMVG
ncbi:MAG TPA: hypothetical protein VLS48_02790, partial [Anaerolineales bacterium]|nr:hypothetical protein [Anaerolineales bacterium]